MATEQKVQTPTTNELEIALLQATFKDNEYLLKLIRGLFFGFALSKSDRDLLTKTFANRPDLKEAVRKKIYPLLSNEPPIGQVADYWMGTESHVLGQLPDTIWQAVESKRKVLEMLNLSLSLLDKEGKQVNLDFVPDLTDARQTWLLARNLYIRTVETGLNFIKIVAESPTSTPEQKAEKAKKDSNK